MNDEALDAYVKLGQAGIAEENPQQFEMYKLRIWQVACIQALRRADYTLNVHTRFARRHGFALPVIEVVIGDDNLTFPVFGTDLQGVMLVKRSPQVKPVNGDVDQDLITRFNRLVEPFETLPEGHVFMPSFTLQHLESILREIHIEANSGRQLVKFTGLIIECASCSRRTNLQIALHGERCYECTRRFNDEQARKDVAAMKRAICLRFHQFLASLNLVREHAVLGYRIDYFDPITNIGIEVDGPEHRNKLDADKQRDREIFLSSRTTLLRFSHVQIENDFHGCCQHVLAALNRQVASLEL